MTTSNEQVTKLPLMKRIVLALRGGVPGGVSAVLVVLLIALVIAIGAGGFLGGVALATQRTQALERNLLSQTRIAKQAAAKLASEKAAQEKAIAELKAQAAAHGADMALLKQQLERAKLERETMDKVLAEIRDGLSGAGTGAAKKVEQAIKGAMLKFADKECELPGGAVKSKADVQCLNLREAIGAMNSAPGGYADKPAKSTEPAKPLTTTPKPTGVH